MNKDAYRFLAALGLGLLLSEARAEYWTVDELVKDFNQVSAQIARGELQTAEASLDAVSQRAAANDVRIGQYQRELASAYLQQGRQQLQAGDASGAAAALARGERHLQAASPALKQQYQAVTAQVGGATPAVAPVARKEPAPERPQPVAGVPAAAPENAEARRDEIERRLREAEAIIARKEAERARQQQLAEEKAAAEREAAAAVEPEPAAALVPVVAKLEAPAAVADNAPQARLIDPSAVSSSVPMPMLDANDRDSLRALLDQVAADVVAFDCAVRLEVREAKDYPFVAALLSARIKKLDPGFAPQFSPVLKPDQEPRLVLSPQSSG
ncbi:hypothetical protein [Pseudomonas subflava]|uniref:hypothetical protein n=1 Tax=Pseudomonas subflava TaxID=2952933 RepID=UPI00207A35DD|nr:hypothetical protein [Pseudomonas subflava]